MRKGFWTEKDLDGTCSRREMVKATDQVYVWTLVCLVSWTVLVGAMLFNRMF
jgi:hypothetical protein